VHYKENYTKKEGGCSAEKKKTMYKGGKALDRAKPDAGCRKVKGSKGVEKSGWFPGNDYAMATQAKVGGGQRA